MAEVGHLDPGWFGGSGRLRALRLLAVLAALASLAVHRRRGARG